MNVIPPSLAQIIDCIEQQKSFLLEAGAGSGKTWTLVETLKYIIQEHSSDMERTGQQVVCITYTNVAKHEITSRIDNHPLVVVLTIHEFLWLVCRNYQSELKRLIVEDNAKGKKKIEGLADKLSKKNIEYSQYGRRLEEGEISHDQVLSLASSLFIRFPKIARIVANKFPYLFVDEYQDTEPQTVSLLLKNLLAGNEARFVIGFFGDSMQKIYNKGVGEIQDEALLTITKTDNYRCSQAVIKLLGKIRPTLVQHPAGSNLPGEVTFIYCQPDALALATNYLATQNWLESQKGWRFKDTKILMLTHKGIAAHQGYNNLLDVYDQYSSFRDRLFEKEERYIKFLCNTVEALVEHYANKRYAEFIQLLSIRGWPLSRHADKIRLKDKMDELNRLRTECTIGEVLQYIFDSKLLGKPGTMSEFEEEIKGETTDELIERRKTFFHNLMAIPYEEVIVFNKFVEDLTPFATKHGVKGAEFTNVLVIIDDGAWNMYKFSDVFAGKDKGSARYERTLNLLYVCCSRAKDRLALLNLAPLDSSALANLNDWFGIANVLSISDLPTRD
ncbi:UvrD-helicase domain-containing protein [Larkinella humicola]|nr:UvrD-helicase domain-containing protein [Larkinella humicola]